MTAIVTPLLAMSGVAKAFPGVQALDGVDLRVDVGEVLGLVGVNGAGKSTLMNILGGVVAPDAGTVEIDGQPVRLSTPVDAQRAGVAFVHQELSLFPNLDIASNVHITNLPTKASMISSTRLRRETAHSLHRVGLGHLSPRTLVGQLRPGEQQLVEIARCLVQDGRILVLDEPTSSLTEPEIATLFRIVRELRDDGVGIIFLSHRLDEIFDLCDRVTVLRDGRHMGDVVPGEVDKAKLVELMLGRRLDASNSRRSVRDELLLEVIGLNRGRMPRDVSFRLHAGEVLGITGLLGSGRTELARCLFGLDPPTAGEIRMGGRQVHIKTPADAIANGMGLLTEDRRREGVILDKPVRDNVVLADLRGFATQFGVMRPSLERAAAERHVHALRIKAAGIGQPVGQLSGGNQQKVVLAKWLQTNPRVLILDEPTRGIDVGAKEEVYRLVADLTEQGSGAIFISSEVDEVRRVSDRVLVMQDGTITAEFGPDVSTQTIMLAAAAGGHH